MTFLLDLTFMLVIFVLNYATGFYVNLVLFCQLLFIELESEDVPIISLFVIGDWHTAYILLYGPKILEIEETPEESSGTKEEPMSTG